MDLGLNERTVIVTGAPGGIGRRLARTFAAEGAHVVLGYRSSKDDAELIAKDIGERALAVRFDLADHASAQALVDATLEWTGRVDVLVNNAVSWGADPSEWDRGFENVDSWQDSLRTNVEGTIALTRAVAPTMRKQGWGRLVHISSTLATDGATGAEYYAAAKAALHGFSRSVAFALGKDGDILSNVVMPGLTLTETNGFITDSFGKEYAARSPIGRLLTADEVARSIVYLSSAANTGITGQVISVNGG